MEAALKGLVFGLQSATIPLLIISAYATFYFVNNYIVRKRIEELYLGFYTQFKSNFSEISVWQQNGPIEYFLELQGRKNFQGAVIKYNTNYVDLFSVLTRHKTITIYGFLTRKIPFAFSLSNKAITRDDLQFCKSSTLQDWKLQSESRVLVEQVLNKSNTYFLKSINDQFISLVVSDLQKTADEEFKDVPLTVELRLNDHSSLDVNAIIIGFLAICDDLSKLTISPELLKKSIKSREELVKKAKPAPVKEVVKPVANKKRVVDDGIRLMGSTTGYSGGSNTTKKKKQKNNKFK